MVRRVLFINTPTYIGGSEVSILTLMRGLQGSGYQPYLVTAGRGPLLDRAQRMGIPAWVQDFPCLSRRRPWPYLLGILRLARAIRTNAIDLVHTNCDHGLPYARWACLLTGVPYLSHVRDAVRSWFRPDKLAVLNRARVVIVSSKAMAKVCVQAGVNGSQVRTIDNPIDLEAFRKVQRGEAIDLRSQLGIPSDGLVVGIVGQVIPLKGHAEFVAACARLAEVVPAVHFMVVGAVPPGEQLGGFLVDLHSRIRETGHANRFRFTGFRDDVPVCMKAMDILSVPSWSEPFGRVAVEGMAAGCAVAASRVDGLAEIIADGVNGLLVRPRDADSLFGALHSLATDPELRARLVLEGRITAERFGIPSHVKAMELLYSSVLAGHVRPQ